MPTSTYWAKRILADEKRAQALTSRAARKTQQAYRASYKRVLREMEGLYAQAQSGGAVTRTQLWRYSHWRGMTEELRKFASSGAALEEQRLTKVLDQVFSNVIGADVKAFGQKQWRTRLNASSVVNTAWSGENYSTRIWRNRALLASRVREEVTQAVLDGKPVGRIAADLQSAFSSSWSQAERLARTETSYVFNQASLRRYAELGIRQVRWITGINDGRECEVCAERSGQVYDLNNAPMMPAHPNCRCAWGAVVEGENDIVEAGVTDQATKANDHIHSLIDGFSFATYDDPMREIAGSAMDSHPTEVNRIIAGLVSMGIEVVTSERDVMVYQPSPTVGKPGRMKISKDASYSAWLHEEKHATDDAESGWQGIIALSDPNLAIEWENRAYQREIDFARENGYNEIAVRLEKLRQERVAAIHDEFNSESADIPKPI